MCEILTDEELLPGLEERQAARRLDPDALPPEEGADGILGRTVGKVDGEEGLDGGWGALPVFERVSRAHLSVIVGADPSVRIRQGPR